MPPRAHLDRRARLKRLYQLRCAQLDIAKQYGWPPTFGERRAYSAAVIKYTRARQKYRAIRGYF